MSAIKRWLTAIVKLHGSPHGIAGGFALGLGLSLVPIPVAGMLAAVALSPVLRLNPAATYLGTAVVNPLTGAAVYFAELWLGLWLTGQALPSWSALSQMGAAQWWANFIALTVPFGLGAAVFIGVLVPSSYAALFFVARRIEARNRTRKGASAEAPAPQTPSQG